MVLLQPFKVSIGILAYNEAELIGSTLTSLFQQTLFTDGALPIQLQVIVVPNGCTDHTADVARTELSRLTQSVSNLAHHQICPLEQPGKANAWNYYVHQFSWQDADYNILMDADIQFIEKTTLSSMLQSLQAHPEAWVSVDRPVKSIALKEKKTWLEQLSLTISKLSGNKDAAWICGQLYCSRGAQLRTIHLPAALSSEDSFIYTMVTTDLLSTEMKTERVVRAEAASHSFDAYLDLPSLFRHERWLVVADAANRLVYQHLRSQQGKLNAGSLIAQKNAQDPFWVNQLIQDQAARTPWIVPRELLFRRFVNLHYKPLLTAIALFPLAIVAACLDALIFLQANQELHRSKTLTYGGKQA